MPKYYYPPEWYAELKQRNNIVSVVSSYITLNRKGRQYWACCPFHHEKTPSFTVNEEGQYYHCFGCGIGGNVVDFVMQMESCDRERAIEILAQKAGMKMPENMGDASIIEQQKKEKNEILKALDLTKEFYKKNLYLPIAKDAQNYLKKRGFKKSDLDNFEIGFAHNNDVIKYLKSQNIPFEIMGKAGIAGVSNGREFDYQSNRLVFPILNSYEETVGFSGRIILPNDERSKYKNTSQSPVFDKSACVYGIHLVKRIRKERKIDKIIIVEGQIDVITMNSNGFSPTVACLGTALTPKHARELKRFCDDVTLLFDGDEAGMKAASRSIGILVDNDLSVKVARLPKGYDPDEFLKNFGKEKMQSLIDNAKHYVEYLLDIMQEQYNLKEPNEKSKCVKKCLEIISALKTSSEQEIYLKLLSQRMSISLETLKRDVVSANSENMANEDKDVLINQEDGNIKAIKYILLAMIKKKSYTNGKASLRKYISHPVYQSLYDKILQFNISGESLNLDEEEKEIYDSILELDDSLLTESFYNECAFKIFENHMKIWQQVLSEKYKETSNIEERKQISAEIAQIIAKMKNKVID